MEVRFSLPEIVELVAVIDGHVVPGVDAAAGWAAYPLDSLTYLEHELVEGVVDVPETAVAEFVVFGLAVVPVSWFVLV